MVDLAITSFNAGELSPLLDARADVQKYSSGCRQLVNMIPLVHGPVTRRPGFQFIATSSSQSPRLIPFIYSDTTAYVCEFGQNYIWFYYAGAPVNQTENPDNAAAVDAGGGIVTIPCATNTFPVGARVTIAGSVNYNGTFTLKAGTSGTQLNILATYVAETFTGAETMTGRLSVATPYAGEDLNAIQYRQIGDVLYLVHPNYPPATLSRTSPTTFVYAPVYFNQGPFMKRNDLAKANGVYLNCSTVGGGTLTATADTFLPGHVGALFQLTLDRTDSPSSVVIAGGTVHSTPLYVKGTATLTTHGTWTATVALQRSEDGGSTWTTVQSWTGINDTNVSYAFVEDQSQIEYRILIPDFTSSSGGYATITTESSVLVGVVLVTAYTDARNVSCSALEPIASTQPTVRWAEGSFSAVRGYPAAIGFFQDRVLYGGTTTQPQNVWFSATDDYNNFDETPLLASSAFEIPILATDRVVWLDALDVVCVGTTGGEWTITSDKLGGALTPTNFTVIQVGTNGCASIMPQKVNSAVLFVDRAGLRVREFAYNANKMLYACPDMTALASHIVYEDGSVDGSGSGIVATAMQKDPDNILWCVRADGCLLSLTYDRDENVIAWARHPVAPPANVFETPEVKSVAVIPGAQEDEVWISCYRINGGSSVYSIERMASRNQEIVNSYNRWAYDFQSDFYLDCGTYYHAGGVTTLSMSYLPDGTIVAALADGVYYPALEVGAVTTGLITFPKTVHNVYAGFPFNSVVEPMRLQVPGRGGNSSQGSFVRIAEVDLSFYRSYGAQYSSDMAAWYDSQTPTPASHVTFSGDVVVNMDGGFDPDVPIIVLSDGPYPLTLRCIVARADKTGR
jgi:hypothetical protein